MASNSLLECVVYASELAKLIPEPIPGISAPETLEIDAHWEQEMQLVNEIRNQLPNLIWQSAGICRTASIMEVAIATLSSWRSQLSNLSLSNYVLNLSPEQYIKLSSASAEFQLKLYAETLNLLDIGYLILKSAAWRTESRGGHYPTVLITPIPYLSGRCTQ